MIVIIKSPLGSQSAVSALKHAAEIAADVVLIGESAAMARKGGLEGFCGTAFALREDVERLLPNGTELEKSVKMLGPEEFRELIEEEGAEGPF